MNTDVKFDGLGYYVFEGEGDTQVGDLGYNFASDVVMQEVDDPSEVFRYEDRYSLRVKSYYWIDAGLMDEDPEFEELHFSVPEVISLIVDREPPEVE